MTGIESPRFGLSGSPICASNARSCGCSGVTALSRSNDERARIRFPTFFHAIVPACARRNVALPFSPAFVAASSAMRSTRSQSPAFLPYASRKKWNAPSLDGSSDERLLEEPATDARRSGGAIPSASRTSARAPRARRGSASRRGARAESRRAARRRRARRAFLRRAPRSASTLGSARYAFSRSPSTSSGANRRAMRAARRKSRDLKVGVDRVARLAARSAATCAFHEPLSACTSSRQALAS